ncbi:hypothetical protein OG453_06990 [Streptomyces sp. NBC_01381]|uniref:hypothetical protein n=1 Tax=Streptomyces sp. NBC_01381 TaxID=2903845 RepID=UPI00224F85C4|nr:hypothetical protein [Streptomyces sp. NBC_01381]MCX4666413.1 hypothetical protein [Streptomyces sp. NBC_01381]
MAGWMRGMWSVSLRHPEREVGTFTYLVPHWQERTEGAARLAATARHTDRASVMLDPVTLGEMVIGEVAYRAAVRSQERAVAWVALVQHDAIDARGWHAAESGERDDLWRQQVREMHERYRERVIGFGDSLADILTSSAGAEAGWDLQPYRDGLGRIVWDDVRADIHKSGLSYTWHTPYGVVWINQG